MKITLDDNHAKIKTAHADAKDDIANLLGWFECEMDKRTNPYNWAQVGDLSHTRTLLTEALSFLSCIPTDKIKESMIESRMI